MGQWCIVSLLLAVVSTGHWLLDLKEGSGSIEPCDTETEADVTMTMNPENLVAIFTGKVNPTTAFMAGKLKIAGNLAHAMALEKLMKKMNSKL